MCGIAGLIDHKNGNISQIAEAMSSVLRHRGPDDGDVWSDPEVGVGLGHRRLSIIDLSSAGNQPMMSSCGRYVIVYNGEIYNVPELRRFLPDGIEWRGHSDTEVLLAAIQLWGVEDALPRIKGMFAFALWDRQRRELVLARDRMGEKPLYYGWVQDSFVFASELKALRVHPDWTGEICREALNVYLRLGYIPAPFSIHQGIYKLLPGCYRIFRSDEGRQPGFADQDPGVRPYWSLEEHFGRDPFKGSGEEAVNHLETLIADSVKAQMVSDVPLGTFLSGGVDSSTITAIMQAQSSIPVRTFTIGFDQADYDEAGQAREVADYLGTQHTELYVSPEDARNVIPLLASLYDEPFADSSQIPTYLVSRMTRDHVTVSLSGDGGDELFGGYNRYALVSAVWGKIGRLPAECRQGLAWILSRSPVGLLNRSASWLEPFCSRYGRRGGVGQKLRKFSEIVGAEKLEDFYLNLLSLWKKPGDLLQGMPDVHPPWLRANCAGSLLDRLTRYDLEGYLPDDILVKVDRAAMGVSLETRVPLLDHNIVEFAMSLPPEMKIRDGQSKWILRQVLYRYLPESLFNRPKRGFALPLGSWLRGPLREWAEELLNCRQLERGDLNPLLIRKRWEEHLSGKFDWHGQLWAVLMFQSWLMEQKKTQPHTGTHDVSGERVAL